MPRATDGTPHASFSRAKHHDALMAERKSKPAPEKPAKVADDGEADENESIEGVVKAHGPAHEMHYEHNKETGKHHVKSKHGEEGHEHDSEHDSSEEAHAHMAKALGHDDGEEEENPDELGEEAGEVIPQMEEERSQRIPGLY